MAENYLSLQRGERMNNEVQSDIGVNGLAGMPLSDVLKDDPKAILNVMQGLPAKSRSNADMKIGDKYQAKLPPLQKLGKEKKPDLKINSTLMWDPHLLKKHVLDLYLEDCNGTYEEHFGTEMPPKAREAAYICLNDGDYDSAEAHRKFTDAVTRASEIFEDSSKIPPFSFDNEPGNVLQPVAVTEKEESLFVASLLLVGKDLRAVADRIPTATPGKIVRYYYEHYKQITYQRSVRERAFRLVEYPLKPTNDQELDPKRIVSALRVLALSNHDSFEVDRRVASAVTLFRNRRTWMKLVRRATAN
mmetsp:Transcript_11867/g.36190  ORF Transcript_11867/g.36190 Transcript_11867/m.36190 type:complete len:303 (+) Transcript_11867:184-1092(+)